MKVKLKYGVDQLLFGMKQKDVEAIYGKPNKQYIDEEDNIVYVYNSFKMRLTFYDEEELRLGYITSTNENLELFDTKIIGKSWDEVNQLLQSNKLKDFETEIVDGTENYFFEDFWLFVNVDYNQVFKIEIGAVFTNQDEFDWKF
ncbi:MAG: hypothetical protein CMP76_06105 [Flavobacterium sp.]|uniref:hypothetical protein n=1 Tax=unclassified Flavobacterium TaxID=196869 RepID=UPI000C429B54|nr:MULTISPECIES: hypothetical protein [unclassified Flavobacterium]MBF02853.1 hypothetical protein [Flavobacterium sp.]MCO6162817.1 hypothetical protein [Flavobacterium sp. NRK F7]|tara:strand:+ start:300 stop:731 length:432 start_codon:yes stop_codon:yes gene_type:complete